MVSFAFLHIFNLLFTNIRLWIYLCSCFLLTCFSLTSLHLPYFFNLLPLLLFWFNSLIFILFSRLQEPWAMFKLDSSSTWNDLMKSLPQSLNSSILCASCRWWSTTSSTRWWLCPISTKPMLTWQPLQTKQPLLSITGRWSLSYHCGVINSILFPQWVWEINIPLSTQL